jgi:hypothetical protein
MKDRAYQDVKKLELDPADKGSIVAEREEDPRNGFKITLGGERTTILFTLSEAKRLGYFLEMLLITADKEIQERTKEAEERLKTTQKTTVVETTEMSAVFDKGSTIQVIGTDGKEDLGPSAE